MIPQLDLHGIKHEDVSRRCDKFLTSIWGNHDCIDIITGNSDRMKQIVIAVVRSYGFNYLDGDFYNRGYISVLN